VLDTGDLHHAGRAGTCWEYLAYGIEPDNSNHQLWSYICQWPSALLLY
jgi:hypothetical protein